MPPTAFPDPWQTPATTSSGHSGLVDAILVDIDHDDDAVDDAAMARRLQQEMDDEELAQRLQGENAAINSDQRRRSLQPLEQPSSKIATSSSHRASINAAVPNLQPPLTIVQGKPITDEDVARKLHQELQDEILAHQLTVQEAQQRQQHPRGALTRVSTTRRVISCVATTVIIAAVIVTLFMVLGGSKGLNLIGISPSFAQNDPFYNKNSTVIPWKTNGRGGLTLTVVNALDTKWYPQFQTAVYQWDNGSPDALTLPTTQQSPDSSCSHIMGKLKVCNGNYGNTQWLGINEQLVQNGWMVASAARMNDFYLDNAAASQKQYTMCHEIGHGFGLPHTDENFYNADLGNCLDYTIHPWVNQQPAAMNFDLLNKTYGTVGTRRGMVVAQQQLQQQQHPDWVMPAFSDAVRRLREEGHERAEDLGWTVTRKSEFGQMQMRHLGEDYMAHVKIMFAVHIYHGDN